VQVGEVVMMDFVVILNKVKDPELNLTGFFGYASE
jgi:hypothetical protein